MCCCQTLNGLPKQCPNKLNKAPCTICYTSNMKNFTKGKIFDTSNLKPGEIIHMNFYFYNVTFIRVFVSLLTLVSTKTRILWVLTTAPKQSPVCIIRFILTTFNN